MRIIEASVLLGCLIIATTAIDEHRPSLKKKDDRGKRNLEYQISHHYSGPQSYRLERRISTGPQHPLYPQSQFHLGPPRPYSPYRKGRPYSYPVPSYAVQMEPLIHYSQRDPLYDTNIFSLNADTHNDIGREDLLTESNQVQEAAAKEDRAYIIHKQHIIERPVYIKEPEPIIEIIIKESNVSLPPPPTTPRPKKKKEQVQVFYVKYKKNPNGVGKNSVIYDKPIPAISPKLPDQEEEEEEEPYSYHPETATAPPPPSTTLRTIIKPDSEVYHSPSGVKVTFGKEGFDYGKRSNKPEDYRNLQTQQGPQEGPQGVPQGISQGVPQGRQLGSFSNAYYNRPTANQNFQSPPPGFRPPQPYRPFVFPSSSSSYRQFGRQSGPPPFSSPPKYPFQSPPFSKPFSHQYSSAPARPQASNSPHFSHSVSHPAPPQFHNSRPSAPPPVPQTRQPVAYKPFENFRQPTFSQPPLQHNPPPSHINPNPQQPHIQFRPETHFPTHQQLPLTQAPHTFNPATFNQPHNIPQQQKQLHRQQPQDIPNRQQFHRPQPQENSEQQQLYRQQHQDISQQQQLHRQQTQGISQQQQLQRHQPQDISQQQQLHRSQPQNTPQQELRKPPPVASEELQPQQNFYQQPIYNAFRNQDSQLRPDVQQQTRQQQTNLQSQTLLQNEHLSNIQTAQNILPSEGQLIQSVPKYEQHFSEIELANGQRTLQNLSPEEYQQKILQQFNVNKASVENNLQTSQEDISHQQKLLQQQRVIPQSSVEQNTQQQQQQPQALPLRTGPQYYHQNQENQQRNLQEISQTTPRSSNVYQATRRTTYISNNTPNLLYQSTTAKPTTTTTEEPSTPSTTTKDPKILEAQLPDEVPDDLREQLLSSGILNNADISILDYDKVGDIPLSALPPDQLANFYNAGGGAQIGAGSAPIPSVLQRDGSEVDKRIADDEEVDQEPEASEVQEVKAVAPPEVEMKVVRYNPETDQGQKIQESYVEEDAQQVEPVVLNDDTYNRYLPLKVNGTQFPIPDVPELKGKKISSVVVLAPLSYDFSAERKTRETIEDPKDIDLIQGNTLKELLANPTSDNYKKFLENENKTSSDKQAVILLVTDPQENDTKEKEIFMYDVATQTVSKLNGELSSAFVEAAEANSSEDNPLEEAVAESSNIVETRVPFDGEIDRQDYNIEQGDLDDSASDFVESKIPIIDPMEDEEMETDASEQIDRFVDIFGTQVQPQADLIVSASEVNSNSVENQVLISSGYSKTGNS